MILYLAFIILSDCFGKTCFLDNKNDMIINDVLKSCLVKIETPGKMCWIIALCN